MAFGGLSPLWDQGSEAALAAGAQSASPTASVPWKGLISAKSGLEPPSHWHPAVDINQAIISTISGVCLKGGDLACLCLNERCQVSLYFTADPFPKEQT